MIEKGVATVDLSAGNATVDDLDGSGIELDRLELSVGTLEQWQALNDLREHGWSPVGLTRVTMAQSNAFRVNVVRNPSAALGVVPETDEPADAAPSREQQLNASVIDYRDRMRTAQKQSAERLTLLEQAQARVAELEGDVATLTGERDMARARAQRMTTAANDYRDRLENARTLSKERLALLTQAQARIDELETEITNWKGSYDNLLKEWSAGVAQVDELETQRDRERAERAEYLAGLSADLRRIRRHLPGE